MNIVKVIIQTSAARVTIETVLMNFSIQSTDVLTSNRAAAFVASSSGARLASWLAVVRYVIIGTEVTIACSASKTFLMVLVAVGLYVAGIDGSTASVAASIGISESSFVAVLADDTAIWLLTYGNRVTSTVAS